MTPTIYKICAADAWAAAVAAGRYKGSADDKRDGFIHFSTQAQLAGTLSRHFSGPDGRGVGGLVLVRFEAGKLGDTLKWEPARDGSLFPHLYSVLDPALADLVMPLEIGIDGRHCLPEDTA